MLIVFATTTTWSVVHGQEAPEPPASPEPPAEDRPTEAPPSLDDLLDIEASGNESEDADGALAESDRRSLDAALAEQEPEAALRAAIDDMLVSSDLLETRQDTGLGTQRLQQRIVDRLQALIDSAARQQQQQQQQSSSSSQSQSQSQQDPGRRGEEPQGGAQQPSHAKQIPAGPHARWRPWR